MSKSIIDKQLNILPKEIKFCKKCVISNQRPRIKLNADGICSACEFKDIKNTIDWQKREHELVDLCNKFRKNDGTFDVVVPVSGGKDSALVSHMLKYKYGMHPITVTWAPFEYTKIGYQNFRSYITKGGFTNLMAWQNGTLHRKLARLAFESVGDVFLPFIYGQMSYAFHIAKAFDINLVFFGENGEAEYSGDPNVFNLRGMPFEMWAEQYFKGAGINELIDYGLSNTNYFTKDDYDLSDLTFYKPPDPSLMREKNIDFHWFSYYHKWIPQENYYYAVENTGFEANPAGRSEGTYSKYASLDDMIDGFHYYLAFIKFGICRATSDAAHEVRDGHLTREEATLLVKRFDGEFPNRNFKFFLDYLNIDEGEFWEIIDKFRSNHIWKLSNGNWILRKSVYSDLETKEDPVYLSSLPESYFTHMNQLSSKIVND